MKELPKHTSEIKSGNLKPDRKSDCECTYGLAPHYPLSTVIRPRKDWPRRFKEDEEAKGLGTWTCEKHFLESTLSAPNVTL